MNVSARCKLGVLLGLKVAWVWYVWYLEPVLVKYMKTGSIFV